MEAVVCVARRPNVQQTQSPIPDHWGRRGWQLRAWNIEPGYLHISSPPPAPIDTTPLTAQGNYNEWESGAESTERHLQKNNTVKNTFGFHLCLRVCIEKSHECILSALYLLDTTGRQRNKWGIFFFSFHFFFKKKKQKVKNIPAWATNLSVSQTNNRRGRWHGWASPEAAQLEPEGDRSSIVPPCNSRQKHLAAALRHSPALITNWSVIHHPQRHWGLPVVGVCVCRMRALERERVGEQGGERCHLWIPALSLFFISTLFHWSSAGCEWVEETESSRKRLGRDSGSFNLKQGFHLEWLEIEFCHQIKILRH